MATEVDKRVVEMQFDNKDFEKNCQASLTTLEKLKMALNFDGAKGLESMGKAASKIDLSNVAKGAEAVQVKFSAMNIAGMTMISELTKGIIGLGKKLWDISVGQAYRGGFARTLKIDQANFQMKALAANMDEVKNGALSVTQVVEGMGDAIDRAVTGTAYGYDAAASVAAQLMASGLTDTETMYDHLRAIAGAASMTGRSFEDIGNIFTTVASNGKLMTMQLRQFSASGLNLSATLAQQLGKTEEEINQLVQHGQISFEQFSKALSESFGEAAGKADETWSGVTSNVRAQISRIGQLFTDPFVKHMIPVLASLKSDIKKFREVLVPVGKTFDTIFGHFAKKAKEFLDNADFTRVNYIVKGLENLALSFLMVADTLRKAFMDLFPKDTIDEVIEAAKEFELFTQKLVPTNETLEGLRTTFKAILSPIRLAYNILKAFSNGVIKPLSISVLQLLGSFLRLFNALAPIINEMVEVLTESRFLDNVFMLLAATIIVVINAVKELVDAMAIISNEIFGSLAFRDLIEALFDIAGVLGKVIVVALSTIFKIIRAIFSFVTSGNIVKIVHNIGQVLAAVIALVSLGIMTIANVIKGIAESGTFIGNVFKLIKDLALLLKDILTGQDVTERLENIKKSLGDVGVALEKAWNTLKEKLNELNAGKLIIMAFGIALIFLVWSLHKFLDASTKVANGFANFFGIFTQIKNILKNFAIANPIIQTLFGLTLVIGMLTASLQTLSTIPNLTQVAVTLGVLLAVVVGIGVVMGLLQKAIGKGFEKTLANTGLALIALSVSILILAESVKRLTDLANYDWQNAIKPLVVVLGLITGLSVVIIALSRLMGDKNAFLKQSVALIAIALAVRMLMKVILTLTNIPPEQTKAMLIGVAAVIGTIVALGAAIGLAGLASKGSLGTLLALIGFVLTVKMLLKFMEALSDKGLQAKVKAGLLALIANVFVPLIAFIAICVVAIKISRNKELFGELAKMFLGITTSVLAMAGAIILLGMFDSKTLVKGWTALLGVMIALTSGFAILMFGVSQLKGHDYKLVIGALKQYESLFKVMAGAIIAFAVSALLVSKVPDDSVAKVEVIFLLMSAVVFGLTWVSKNAQGVSAKPILAIAATIALLMGGLAVLSLHNDPKALVGAGAAIMLTLLGLGAILAFLDAKETKDMEALTKDKARASKFFALSAFVTSFGISVGIIAVAINSLASVKISDPDQFRTLMIWFASMAGGFAILSAVITGISKNVDKRVINSVTLLILSLIAAVAAIMGSLVLLANTTVADESWTTYLALFTSLVSLFVVMAVVGIAMTEVAKHVTPIRIKQTTLVILSLVGALAVVAIIVGALAQINMTNPVAANIAIIATGLIMAGIGFLALKIIEASRDISIPKLLTCVGVIVAMAGSMVIVALGFKMIVDALLSSGIGKHEENTIIATVSMFVMIISLLSIIALAFIKLHDEVDIPKLLTVAGSFAILALAISAVALSISLIAKEKITKNSLIAIGMLTGIIIAMIGIGALMIIFHKTVDVAKMWTVAGAFAAMGVAIAALILALKELVKVSRIAPPSVFKEIRTTLWHVLGIFAILAVVGGVLGAFASAGGIGAMILGGIIAMVLAFDLFALGVETLAISAEKFAKSVKSIADTVLMFNYIDVDGERIVKNLEEAIDAFVETLPDIFYAIDMLIDNSVDALGRFTAKFSLLAIQFVVAFIEGLDERVPELVDRVLSIIKKIADAARDEKNLQIIEDFANAIGQVIVRVIKGLLSGIFDWINNKIDEIRNKYQEEQMRENIKVQNVTMRREQFEKNIDKINFDRAGDKFMDEDYAKYLAESFYDDNGRINNVYDMISDSEKELFEKIQRSGNEQKEIYDQLLSSMTYDTSVMDKTGNSIEQIRDGYVGLAKVLNLDEEYQERLAYVAGKTTLAFDEQGRVIGIQMKSAADAVEETYDAEKELDEATGTVIEDSKKASEATTQAASETKSAWDSVKSMFGTDVFNDFINGASGLFENGGVIENLKDAALTSKDKFAGALTKVGEYAGEKFGFEFDASVLDNVDYQALTTGLLDGSIDMADILGTVTGKTQARAEMEAYNEEIERLRAEGMEKVITDENVYKQSHGASGFSYAWQLEVNSKGEQLYRGIDDYTQAKYQAAHADDAAAESAKNYWKITDEVTEALEDNTKAQSKYVSGVGEMSDATVKATKKFGEFYNGLKNTMTDALKNIYDEVGEENKIGTDEMLKRMEENTKRIGKWARQLRELAARGMSEGLLNELKDMGPQAADKVDAFARMSAEQLEQANRLFESKSKLPDYATEAIVNSYKEAGFYSSLGFAEGVDPTVVETAFRKLGMEGLEALESELGIESPSKKTRADGIYAVMGLAEGLTNVVYLGLLKTAVTKLANVVIDTLRNKLSPTLATKLGMNFVAGLSNGFTGQASIRDITNKVNNIANSVMDKIRNSWEVHSPSKKAEELGLFFMKGLGIGLDNGASYLENQTGETADDIFQSMKDQLYGSLANITEDGVYQPVVRPVFDLSALDEGWNYINSWFAEGRTISLAGNIQRLTPTTKENNDILDREILDAVRNIDVDGVRNELNGIRTDISELQTAVTNLQVVMDTGALVGQLVNPMDNALGAKALMNGRGRY